jgi:hypothetical protein
MSYSPKEQDSINKAFLKLQKDVRKLQASILNFLAEFETNTIGLQKWSDDLSDTLQEIEQELQQEVD